MNESFGMRPPSIPEHGNVGGGQSSDNVSVVTSSSVRSGRDQRSVASAMTSNRSSLGTQPPLIPFAILKVHKFTLNSFGVCNPPLSAENDVSLSCSDVVSNDTSSSGHDIVSATSTDIVLDPDIIWYSITCF